LFNTLENNEHKKLVKGIIDHFESKGLKIISAAYDGFEKCEIIGNHEPSFIIVAIKTKFLSSKSFITLSSMWMAPKN